MKKQKNITVGVFRLDEVLPFYSDEKDARKEYIGFNEQVYNPKMNFGKYKLFAKNNKCVCCGIEGIMMLLQKYPEQQEPHFNMYGLKDDQLILMIKGFVSEDYENLQTICKTCNDLKGDKDITLAELQKLRAGYELGRFDENGEVKNSVKKINEILKKGR